MKTKQARRDHYIGLMKRVKPVRRVTKKKLIVTRIKPGPVITIDEFDKLIRDGNKSIKESL